MRTNAPNGYCLRVDVSLLTPCHNEASIGGIGHVTKEIHSGAEEGFQASLIAQEVEDGKAEAGKVEAGKANTGSPSDHGRNR